MQRTGNCGGEKIIWGEEHLLYCRKCKKIVAKYVLITRLMTEHEF